MTSIVGRFILCFLLEAHLIDRVYLQNFRFPDIDGNPTNSPFEGEPLAPVDPPTSENNEGKIHVDIVDRFLDGLIGGEKISGDYQSQDGWYNNRNRPDLGSTGGTMSRLTLPRYADGKGQPVSIGVPNPFELSSMLTANASKSYNWFGKNALLVFFGEHISNEIIDTRLSGSCPPEYTQIDIPKGHKHRKLTGHTYMPFRRARYSPDSGKSVNNPRRMINQATPFIDGGAIYGRSKMVSDQLRSFENGRLRIDADIPPRNRAGLPLVNNPSTFNRSAHMKPIEQFLLTGDHHGNEHPFLLSINVMWARWHNLIADWFKRRQPNWNDDQIFTQAKRWVIATQQSITINEWLPIWTNQELPSYTGYKAAVNPAISHLFSGAAMRYGHVLVPSFISSWNSSCTDDNGGNLNRKMLRLCNSFFNSFNLKSSDYRSILMGLLFTSSRPDGPAMSDELRYQTFGPMEFTRRDLAVLNIQRGRDFGLPDYLSTRSFLNLSTPADFTSVARNLWSFNVTDPQGHLTRIKQLYRSVSDIDVWYGGLMESSYQTGIGETFRRIINSQFERIRDADFFWFQNRANGLFDERQIQQLENISLQAVIGLTFDLDDRFIQPNPFLLPNADERSNGRHGCFPKNLQSFVCARGQCFALYEKSNSSCPRPQTFDYTIGSELPFLITLVAIVVYAIFWLVVLWVLVKRRKRQDKLIRNQSKRAKIKATQRQVNTLIAFEWEGDEDNLKPILVQFEPAELRISIKCVGSGEKLIRRINFKGLLTVTIQISVDPRNPLVLVKFVNEHDLIIRLDSEQEQRTFVATLESFLASIGVGRERLEIEPKRILRSCYSKRDRQRDLESFFRAVFAHAFDIGPLKSKVDLKVAKNILKTELTEYEFAEALAMRPDSLFVKQMFSLVDKDENGYISFREFLDMMIIFAKGSSDQKAKLMFDMYDLDGTGSLSKEEFSTMMRSMLELANQSIGTEQLELLMNSMFKSSGLDSKSELYLTDFLKFLGDYKDELGYVELNIEVGDLKGVVDSKQKKRQSAINRAQEKLVRSYSIYRDGSEGSEQAKDVAMIIETSHSMDQQGWVNRATRFVDEMKWHIFWFLIFVLIAAFVLFDALFFHWHLNEHRGLRRMASIGVGIAKGSANVIMFVFALVLLTMSRNLITVLRETFLHKYIPFDASVSFHKTIAIVGLIFAISHSIGHIFNFYHIMTQRPSDLACLFPYFQTRSHEFPKFTFWAYQTIAGLTGVLLLALMVVIYVFSMPVSRRYVFTVFWSTHNLYPLFYFLMFLHGMSRLVSAPLFTSFVIIPLTLFLLDRLTTISRKKSEIRVIRAVHYPSNVTLLCLAKPESFEYKSGQWVRIASVGLNPNEFHPFTLASAPHEEHLQLYIRAIGPFTTNIRKLYDPNGLSVSPYPNIRLDGPYGETHQDWFRYPVSVLVGGGIGVTPFASILKDVAFRASINRMSTCSQVYFLWVTRTQKHFEWLVDILRDLEEKDVKSLVRVHIFITQFYDKFDLRTMMLYVCERHFQRISNRSLFTGLKAKTQFGRPNFHQFFNSLQRLHPKVGRIGVFSCGPSPMTTSVGAACERLNRQSGALFIHHSENF